MASDKKEGRGVARWIIDHRWSYLIVSTIITIVAIVGALRMEVRPHFSDLLPRNSSIIDVFKQYGDFSSPLDVQILIHSKEGTIYTPQTLGAIFKLTRDIDLLPGVDHNTVVSIASSKVRVTSASPSGVESFPVMPDVVPSDDKGCEMVRDRGRIAAGVMGILVSPDEKSTLVQAAFHEQSIDYKDLWNRVHNLLKQAREKDPNLEFYPAGRIMMTGWVFHYGEQALYIFMFSFFLIALAHIDYMRSLAGAGT
ncbi:MAG TPA: hypothetical protein VEF03_09095, partial [Candidatus Binataceae bacterium]|nr:hypothetical protein [Candidatus Binataceae bacterium]